MDIEEFYIKNSEMLKAKLNLLQDQDTERVQQEDRYYKYCMRKEVTDTAEASPKDQRKETAFCPDCIVAKYPPCDEHIPCCKCEKKQNECNSWQPCPKREGKEE